MRRRVLLAVVSVLMMVLVTFTGCGKFGSKGGESGKKLDEPEPTYYDLHLKVEFLNNIILDIYDIDIYLGDKKIDTLSQGDTFDDTISLEEGTYDLYFYKVDDKEVHAHRSLTMDDERYYICSLKSHGEEIEIKDETNESQGEIDAQKAAEEEREREEAERKAEEEKQQALQVQLETELDQVVRGPVNSAEEKAAQYSYSVINKNLDGVDVTEKFKKFDEQKREEFRIASVSGIDHENKTVTFEIATVKKLEAIEKSHYKGLKKEPLNKAIKIADSDGYTVRVKNREGKRVDNKDGFDSKKYAFMSVDKVRYDKAVVVFNADTKKHLAKLAAEKERKAKEAEKKRKEAEESAAKEKWLDEIVIATATGNCYHTDDCRTLRKTRYKMTRREARRRGLTDCDICHVDFGHYDW